MSSCTIIIPRLLLSEVFFFAAPFIYCIFFFLEIPFSKQPLQQNQTTNVQTVYSISPSVKVSCKNKRNANGSGQKMAQLLQVTYILRFNFQYNWVVKVEIAGSEGKRPDCVQTVFCVKKKPHGRTFLNIIGLYVRHIYCRVFDDT